MSANVDGSTGKKKETKRRCCKGIGKNKEKFLFWLKLFIFRHVKNVRQAFCSSFCDFPKDC